MLYEVITELRLKNLITKYRATRNQIFELLNVNSYAEIQGLIQDRERRMETDRRAYLLLGNMFGIHGSEKEIISRVNTYSQTARITSYNVCYTKLLRVTITE